MADLPSSDSDDSKEAERRMNEALTRALNTPPKAKPTPKRGKGKGADASAVKDS